LSPAPAGFVTWRNRTLFYNALDYKSNASLKFAIRNLQSVIRNP
jgi:hypothetical protein